MKKMNISYTILIGILVVLAALCLYPIWYTLIVSLSDKAYVNAGKVWIIPRGFTLNSYKKVMEDSVFFKSFLVSVERVVLGCLINMLLLIFTAYPLCLPAGKVRGSKYYKWFFIANMLFNGGLIPSYVLMKQYNLFDSIWALILPGAVPLWNLILLVNFFRIVPYELNEAATIDGASPLSILWNVYVPLSKPSLACLLLFQFIGHWNSWFDGLVYINKTEKQPLQTYIYQISAKLDFSSMTSEEIVAALKMSDKTLNSAKVIIALIPIMCIYPFIQKYFVKGMTLGSVKG